MKYYLILIAIYNDTDDGVLTEDGFTYIYKEIMAEDLAVLARSCQDYVIVK